MSKIHALTQSTNSMYSVVLHTAMPSGNNAVGNSWKDCWVAAGRAVTTMAEGTGLGQITTAEKAQVVSGDVIEIVTSIPMETVVQGDVVVNAFADLLIAKALDWLGQEFNYYGWTD